MAKLVVPTALDPLDFIVQPLRIGTFAEQTFMELGILDLHRSILEDQDFPGRGIPRFTKYQLQLMIERIIDLGVEERPNHTAELCDMILNRQSQLTRDRAQASRELASAWIPDLAIRPVAFEFHERRKSSADSPDRDWFDALAQLRDRYTSHYLQTQFVKG